LIAVSVTTIRGTIGATVGKPDCCTDAVRRSHRLLRDRLTDLAEQVLAQLPHGADLTRSRAALVSFVRGEIVPRAVREETVAWTADPAVQQVVRALPGHHRLLEVLLEEICADTDGVTAAAAIGALVLLCDARWDGEERALLPALAAAGVDLEPLVD
jgi:hypothetical protein